jgi:hypothetical protein
MHDEVLARLLDLNQQRYEAEILGGKAANKGKKTKAKAQAAPTIPSLEEQSAKIGEVNLPLFYARQRPLPRHR